MNRLFAGFILALLGMGACHANIVDERELEDLYAASSTIVFGYVKSSMPSKCGGRNEMSGLYVVHVRNVVKGDMKKRDIKVCVQAKLLLSDDYIIAGERYGKNELVAGSDAVVMSNVGHFYRVISDDPVRHTPEGDVYAVAKLVPDFMKRFGYLFGSVEF